MSHLKFLTLDNYRVFDQKTKFEISSITYLTGPNSSGKSSIFKSLLLLKTNCNNDLQVLDFSGPKHNLGSFENSLNYNIMEKRGMIFGLEASIGDSGFSGSFYKEPITTKRSVYHVLKEIESTTTQDIQIELNYFQNERSGELRSIELFLKNNSESFLKLIIGGIDDTYHMLKFDYDTVSKNKVLKKIFIDDVIRNVHKIKKNKKPLIYKLSTHFSIEKNATKRFFNEPTLIFGKLYEQFINENVELEVERDLHEYLFRKPLRAILNDFSNIIENTEYLEAVRANTRRLYTNDSQGTSFNELILDYQSRDISQESIDFTNHWLKKFEIADSLAFINIEGVATTIYLQKGSKKVALADLGYGFTQFLPILLRVAMQEPIEKKTKSQAKNRINFNIVKKLILLEEPETNLHPRLQSLLADFLVDATKKFELRFIVETHSEYIIRRSQLLAAEKKISLDDIVIYYFNSDKNVNENEKKIRKIQIKENGSLSDQFGEGFYDEATNLKLELLKQKNISK
jgi:predicted ATPase